MSERRPQPASRPPGRPRDARADTAIIQAAAELLTKDGFAKVTVDAVAAQAGVGKATIYRRWPSKEALLLEAGGTLVTTPVVPDTGEVRTDLLELLGQFREVLHHTGAGALLPDLVAEAGRNPEMAGLMADYVFQRAEPLHEVLGRAVDRGEVRGDIDVVVVGDALAGALLQRHLVTHLPIDDHVLATIVDVVLDGIASG